MKRYKIKLITFITAIVLTSCCPYIQNVNYYELGPAVLQASSLFLTLDDSQLPDNIDGEFYKSLLKEEYKNLYTLLLPYQVEIQSRADDYVIKVYDKEKQILTDLVSTEGYLDKWEIE